MGTLKHEVEVRDMTETRAELASELSIRGVDIKILVIVEANQPGGPRMSDPGTIELELADVLFGVGAEMAHRVLYPAGDVAGCEQCGGVKAGMAVDDGGPLHN